MAWADRRFVAERGQRGIEVRRFGRAVGADVGETALRSGSAQTGQAMGFHGRLARQPAQTVPGSASPGADQAGRGDDPAPQHVDHVNRTAWRTWLTASAGWPRTLLHESLPPEPLVMSLAAASQTRLRSLQPGRRPPPRLDARRGCSAVRAAVQRPAVPCAVGSSHAFRSECRAVVHPAVDQDRRLPGRLRVLPAERALQTPA